MARSVLVQYAPAERELATGQPPPEAPDPSAPAIEPGLNLPLLAVLLVILALVAASNLWLRRRAVRDRQADRDSAEPGLRDSTEE